jgi:7,8-dihydropterin-6-yl-methyl-4-(beta-D-ribofuranosyl)aminobenzene 5'-phosphate synthase
MTVSLLAVDSLEITTLVDNQVDGLLAGAEGVQRRPWGPAVANPFIDAGGVVTSLHAEHGFSALLRFRRGVDEHTVLFDAGVSPYGLVENMDRLDLSPKDIEGLVLSHGHFDHTGGIAGVVERLGRARMPMILHPAAYTRRRNAVPGRQPTPLPPPSRSALEGAGFELVEHTDPSVLFAGSLLVTGEVARTTAFEQGFPFFEREVDGAWEPEPHVPDDQAVVFHVRDRGLVVLSGCGHAGIVNIVRHAIAVTGIDRVHAVLGGFHLSGPVFEPVVAPTVDALAALSPAMIVPAHCTGYRAQMVLATALPDAYVHNAVGTSFRFG